MGDQKDKKDIKDSPGPIPVKDSPGPIPEGWVLYTKFRKDGIEVKTYLCPATEQEFYTYEDLMRYVRYAKAAKLSIYSPEFEEYMKKRGQSEFHFGEEHEDEDEPA